MTRYLTRSEIVDELRAQYVPGNHRRVGDRAGSATALAAALGVSHQLVRQVLCGAKPPTKKMLAALGYDPTPRYARTRG